MAYRNRTQELIRLREDHTIRRRKYTDRQSSSAKKNLLDDTEVEMKEHIVYLPPEWIARVSDIQYEVTNIRTKLHDLAELHKAHLLPGFHDRDDEEQAIDIATSDLTKMFRKAQAAIKGIKSETLKAATVDEKQLRSNIRAELAREVQDLSLTFRSAQKTYLQALNQRTKKVGNIFSISEDIMDGEVDSGFTDAQMQKLTDITADVTQRERDIIHIAKSISELAEIFNDLNTLVIDQGTILDRIDYNLEHTDMNIDAGIEELKKANESDKSSRTKMCILMLLVLIICAVVVIVIKAIAT